MKKQLSFFVILGSLMLNSCDQQIENFQEHCGEQITDEQHAVRDREAAIEIAVKAFRVNNSNVEINANAVDVDIYTGGIQSRSVEPQSIYVINFEGGGFALVPAADNGIDVYGMSDTGKFVVNPDDENDLGSYILSMASGLTPITPITPGVPIDSTDVVECRIIKQHNGHECYYDSITSRTGSMSNYLLKTEWDTGEPYNAFTPMYEITPDWIIHSAVGCVPVAMGQIMAYHKYPRSHVKGDTTYEYNWSSILSEPSYTEESDASLNTASLLYSIADECDMDWGAWVSWASSTKPRTLFPKFGYNISSSDWKLYDYETIKQQLANRLPVYIDGRDINDANNGHAWVIDGYYHRQTVVKYTNIETNEVCEEKVVYDLPLVHCNWGWGGLDNGWFRSDIFPTTYGDLSGKRWMLINIKPNR